MLYRVTYKVGKALGRHIVAADSLEEAEKHIRYQLRCQGYEATDLKIVLFKT